MHSVFADGFELKLFNPSDDYELYKSFMHLRFDVFSNEMEWHNLLHVDSPPDVIPAGFQRRGHYVLIQAEDSCPVAISRTLKVSLASAGSWTFGKHLQSPLFAPLADCAAAITDVAVIPKFRKVRFHYKGHNLTIGQGLVFVLFEHFLKDEDVIFGAATPSVVYKFFRKLGAYLLDFSYEDCRSPQMLVNFAFLSQDRKRFADFCSPLVTLARGEEEEIATLSSVLHQMDCKNVELLKRLFGYT